MDFLSFKEKYQATRPVGMTDRSFILWLYRKFLDGTNYDILTQPFSSRTTMAQNILQPQAYSFQTVGMSSRRPSVRSTLCSLVVEDSVSFIFDETHFPQIKCSDPQLEQVLVDISEESKLNLAMIQVARDGSVGSAALNIKLMNGRFYYESLLTEYCHPIFDYLNPNELISLREEYPVSGEELLARGYKDVESNKVYCFRREWTRTQEILYIPSLLTSESSSRKSLNWGGIEFSPQSAFAEGAKSSSNKKDEKEPKIAIDYERSIVHDLGFVPVIWAKNLPGNIHGFQGSSIDGACTFSKAIDTNIELDYQLSQCGRGLKYTAEPIMFIKDPGFTGSGTIDKENGGVMIGDENSDAKMIEINGDGCRAVIEYAQLLRELALENIHGNRSSAKKSGFQQSGKALEMFNHPLIVLSGLLRISYGEGMLKTALGMIARMLSTEDVRVNGVLTKNTLTDYSISISWPQWFDQSPHEDQIQTANAISAKDAGLISQASATSAIAQQFAITNITEEIKTIEKEEAQFITEDKPQITEKITA